MDHHVYTPRRKKSLWRRFKASFFIFFAVAVLGGGTYFLLYSSAFKIHGIFIIGVDDDAKDQFLARVEGAALQKGLASLLGNDHYFAWPNKFSAEWADFKSVTLGKSFFNHMVTITAVPRVRYGIWCLAEISDGCFWFDEEDGILLEPAAVSEGQIILNIHDAERTTAVIGSAILPREEFARLLAILKSTRSLQFGIRTVELFRSLEELHITTAHGTLLKFSVRFDPDPLVLNAFAELVAEHPLGTVEYIDFSVQNKAYLKKR